MQVGEWLGFVTKTISMTFRIPEKKVCKLQRLLNSAIQNKSSSSRELARITGSILSVALAVGLISRLLTKQMYLAIESRSAWDHIFLFFPPALLEELKFGFVTLNLLMVTPPPPPPFPRFIHCVVFSDASDAAFGGIFRLPGRHCGQLYVHDRRFVGQSSTFRELKAIYYVLVSFC